MNLIEHYITKIFYEKPFPTPKFDEQNRKWVYVEFECNCYGRIACRRNIYPIDEWEEIKKKGYFLG